MKTKRWFLLLVVMLTGALLLSACGGGTTNTNEAQSLATEPPLVNENVAPTEAPTEEVMEEATPTEEIVEEPTEEQVAEETPTTEATTAAETSLTIWADDTRAPILRDLGAAFEEEFGVAIVVEEYGFGDIRDQLSIAGPAGEGPDIIIGAHDWLGELVTNGLLAPLDLGEKEADFAPAALEAFTYNGELYGMPYATENVAFFRNTDLVPEAPETWDEVIAIAEELEANNDENVATNVYGFVRMEGDAYHFFPIQTSFGGYVFGQNPDGTYDVTDVGIDSEGSLAAAEWWNMMVQEGHQPPAVDWDTMHAWFENGQIAMTITGPWALERFRNAGVPYAISPIPSGTEEGRPFLGVQGFMVSAFSEDPLLAQIFLTEYVATTETMLALYEAGLRPPAYLPALEQVDDPDLAAFAEAGVNALPMPANPEMASVWTAWEGAIVLIAQQADEPVSAFETAAEQIRTAIEDGS